MSQFLPSHPNNQPPAPETEWKKVQGAPTQTYASLHRVIIVSGYNHPKWQIVKVDNMWVVYQYLNGVYWKDKVPPFKTLKSAKYHCDVESERFTTSKY